MAQIGNKINSGLNGEWAKHVKWFGKRLTASLRRLQGQKIIREELEPDADIYICYFDDEGFYKCPCWACQNGYVEDEMYAKYLKRESDKQLFNLEELCVLKKAA